jgi:hypothetical protein
VSPVKYELCFYIPEDDILQDSFTEVTCDGFDSFIRNVIMSSGR